jgi:hypothetical protein
MRAWQSSWEGNSAMGDFDGQGMMGGGMMGGGMMMDGMSTDDLRRADDVDLAFIDAMIPHHQGAVMMAERVRSRTERPELKQLAEDIIAEQEAEITQLRQQVAALEARLAEFVAPPNPTSTQVLDAVCRVWGHTRSSLTIRSRSRAVAWPRQAAMALMRKHCPDLSSPEIARTMGISDHTTILYGAKQARWRAKNVPEFGERMAAAETIILTGGHA